MRIDDEHGMSLVEVIIAAGILAVSLASLAQLFPIAIHDNIAARDATYETILAEQKIEELRALTWGFDPHGAPIGDPRLSSSPTNALAVDTPGFVDYLDQFGRLVGGGVAASPEGIYTRRWAIDPLPADPEHTLVVQVLVTRTGSPAPDGAIPRTGRVRLVTVRARKPQ
jgi:hypothetical protein